MKTTTQLNRSTVIHPGAALNPEQAAQLSGFKRLFWNIDRILTGIANAEAGNLDAVQALLDHDRAIARARQANGSTAARFDLGSAAERQATI